MRKAAIIFFFILNLLLYVYSYAQSPAIESGVGYLFSSQNPDRSWGGAGSSTGAVASTVAVLDTFKLLNQTDLYEYAGAVSWLQNQSLDTTENLSERILALTAGGADQDKLVAYIDSLMKAWGGYDDFSVNIIDTVYAVQALKTVSYPDHAVFSSALTFLTSCQNPDGGWGFYKDDRSNTYVTSLVLSAFSRLKATYPGLLPFIEKAAAYVLSRQNPDGGFGSSPSSVHETALAYEALVASGIDVSTSAPLAVNYLAATQQQNGSWDNDTYATALALRALSNVKPNLTITTADIAFSQAGPTQGDAIIITVNVKNSGASGATNVHVQIFDGDPAAGGTQIGPTFSIPSIAPGAAGSVQVNYPGAMDTERHAVYAVVDPFNTIDELSEGDNRAVNYFTPLSRPDIMVDETGTTYAPAVPTVDVPLRITFAVRNKGEKGVPNVPVRLYRGLPENNGTVVSNSMIPQLPGLGSYPLTIEIANPPAGLNAYYLIADPDNIFAELDETNNHGMIMIAVEGSKPTDLSVSSSTLYFSIPADAQAGSSFVIQAPVSNHGSTDVTTAVAFYSGDPAAGGTLLGTTAITVPALNVQTASLTWTLPPDNPTIFVVVDPDSLITETTKANNKASKLLDPLSAVPDLTIDGANIVYQPSCVTPRTYLTMEATVVNKGGSPMSSYAPLRVDLYDGVPGSGGVLKGSFAFLDSDQNYPLWYRTGYLKVGPWSAGTHELYVVVDPLNAIKEYDEMNNRASIVLNVSNDCSKDIFISSDDISFSPAAPPAGSAVSIAARAHNSGSQYEWVNISFYNGNPAAGGALIRRVLNTYVNQQDSAVAAAQFTMTSGVPEIFVVVDDDNKLAETDESNNIASKTIDTYKPDLFVGPKDITIRPVAPSTGEAATVKVTVHSSGTSALSGLLNLYEGTPEEGRLIGSQAVAVPGNATTTFDFANYVYPGGGVTLTAVVENVAPAETDGTNNRASARFGERISAGTTNEGTDFWLAWPPTYYRTASIVIQSRQVAQVDVTIPSTSSWPYPKPSWSGTVSPGTPAVIPLTLYVMATRATSAVENKAIHVTSDKDISVLFHTPDTTLFADDNYLALPAAMVGTRYYVLSYPHSVGPIGSEVNSFTVVATEDNTDVDVGGAVITLNKGQIYVYNTRVLPDLTGTYVTSSKPVAFIASTGCSNIPPGVYACDSLLEQMLPVSLLGTDHFTAPLYSPLSGDLVRVLATENGTSITVMQNGVNRPNAAILNKGEWTEFDLKEASHITSDKPVMVAQYAYGLQNAGAGDPLQMTIIPTDKLRTEYRFYSQPGYGGFNTEYPQFSEQGNFMTVIAPEAGTAVTLDGMALADNWQTLPDYGSYLVAQVGEGEHVVTANKPIAVYSHGYGYYTSYGYPAGVSVPQTNLKLSNPLVAPAAPTTGQLLELSATLLNEGDLEAREVFVRAYNGDPLAGGTPIGLEIYIPMLRARETRTVSFTWNSLGQSGLTKLYIVADPIDSIKETNETDNIAMLTVTLSDPTKPDPTIGVSDLFLSSERVKEGETVTLSARVVNRGAASSSFPVSLYLGDPLNGGRLLEQRTISQVLGLGDEAALDFSVPTIGFPATSELHVVIDPDNLIDELNENNNRAAKTLLVDRRSVAVSVATDGLAYTAQTAVGINVAVKSESATPWTGTGEVVIENAADQKIAHVANFTFDDLRPWGMEGWRYRVPATVLETRDLRDAVAVVDLDCGAILASMGVSGKVVDQGSVRVLELDGADAIIGEKRVDAAFPPGAPAKIRWLLDGPTQQDVERRFAIYFDTTDNGPKTPSAMTGVPVSGRLVSFGGPTLTGSSGMVYVMENKPDGTFGVPQLVDTLTPSNLEDLQGVVLDDFDNDGYLDIVTGSRAAGSLYFYRNTADGTNTFQTKSVIAPAAAMTKLADMVSGDFNKDGNRDFAANTSETLDLFLGNGDGTFTQRTLPLPPVQSRNYGVYYFAGKTAADVDNDGNQDLLIADGGLVYLYWGNGDGTFWDPIKITDFVYVSTTGLVAADFDRDGKTDFIATKAYDGSVYFFKGNGDGTFAAPAFLSGVNSGGTAIFDADDYNGDGIPDLIASSPSYGVIHGYPGKGDGTFGVKAVLAQTTGMSPKGLSAYLGSPEVRPVLGAPESAPVRPFTFAWNTGTTSSGSYKVHVTLEDGGLVASEGRAAFDILPDKRVHASAATSKASYGAQETAALTAAVTSLSVNYAFENLTASLSISAGSQVPGAGTQLFTETRNIRTLMPGAAFTFTSYWNTGTYPAGTYPVTLEVKDTSGAVIATGTQNIIISSTVKLSAALKGQISVDKQSLLSGEPVTASYTVTNTGNIDLANVALSIKTVNVRETVVYDAMTDQASLPMGADFTDTRKIDTAPYGAMDYLVVLQASLNGTEETLAGTYFRVEGAPTAPSLIAPQNGADVETFIPALVINNASDSNDDRLTYEFEIYADSGLTQLVTSSGVLQEGSGSTAWQVPVSLQENTTYFWRSRAYDGMLYGPWMSTAAFRVNTVNDPPTAPIPTSPPDNGSVDTLTPVLTVTNATDPDSQSLTYNFEISLDPDFNQIAASTRGVFSGQGTTSWQVPVDLSENSTYYWRAQADDWLVEGPWSATSRFLVNTANDAPTVPVIISPMSGSEVAGIAVDITAANSTDPDSSVITYFFEVDTVMTFDSTDLIRSGSVPEGQGSTIWQVSGLKDNTTYYARVKASDGMADSLWSAVVSFFANTANDAPTAPTLANPSNGSGVNTFTPALSVFNSIDADHDMLIYEFELYSDAAMASLVASASTVAETAQITSWTAPVNLTENQTYYWRVRAYDGELYSAWMAPASFMVNTANDAPIAPRLSSPVDGSSVDTVMPTLTILNATDPDSDRLTYDFEVYSGGTLVATFTGVPESFSGTTSVTLNTALADNTVYQWRARAFDGDRYGPWMDTATFSVHVPKTSINATIDFDPNTLDQKSKGTWVVVYIELPAGNNPADIDVSTVRLEGTIPAEPWPHTVGDYDKDGIPDHMIKFRRSDVIAILPNGEQVPVHVTGKVGETTFEGVDIIRVIH